jgi:hypothetical protein
MTVTLKAAREFDVGDLIEFATTEDGAASDTFVVSAIDDLGDGLLGFELGGGRDGYMEYEADHLLPVPTERRQ